MKVTIKLSHEESQLFIAQALKLNRNIPDTILVLALAKLKSNTKVNKHALPSSKRKRM